MLHRQLTQALVVLCCAVPTLVESQTSRGLEIPRRPHTVSRWTVVDGLPGNVVRDLVQSVDGRLWLIAGGVLVRFDGDRFATVELPGPPSRGTPSDEYLLQIERGGGDTLWVATSTGRLLARARGVWQDVSPAATDSAAGQAVEMRAAPGALPILRTYFPTATLRRGGVRLVAPWLVQSDTLGIDNQVGIDADGTLWAMDRSGRMARPVMSAERQGSARTIPMVTGGLVYRGDGYGFLGVRRANGRLELLEPDGSVAGSITDAPGRTPRLLTRDGRVVVTTRDGLEIYHQDGTPVERIPLGAPAITASGVTVNALIEDRDGGLWVGTDVLGLLHLRPAFAREFSAPNAASNQRQVRIVVPGARGSVLALTERTLYRLRGDRATPVDYHLAPEERGPYAAAEDSRGALWTSLVAERRGVVLIQQTDGTTRRYLRPQLPLKFVEDRRRGEMLWLEADHWCRVPLTPPTQHAVPRCTALGSWGARDLLLARDGTVWIAGQPGVRAETDTGTRFYTDRTGYPLGLSRALHEDADGILWIGTYRRGLGRLARTARGTDSLVMLSTRVGLAEDVVSTIVEDTRGMLWMGGNRGIHAVARADVDAWLSGRIPRLPVLRVDHRDGLTNAEGSGWYAARDEDGLLWFPTFGGAVRVDPYAESPQSAASQRAVIDQIHADTLPFAVRDTVTLPVGVRRLQIDFGTVRLRSPGEGHVEYRLEGHTGGWTVADDAYGARLAGLRPGTWRFEVRLVAPTRAVVATGGAPGDDVTSIVFRVPPTFRESIWYRLLLSAGLGALVLVGVTLRTRWLTRQAAALQDEVERQTQLVRAERDRTAAALEQATTTGAQLRDLLTAKSRVFASLSHELRTPMSLIVGPLHELEREADAQFPPNARGHLGAIAGAVRRLQRLTTQFLDLADAQSGVLRLHLQRVSVGPFVQQCVEQVAPLATPRGVRVTMRASGNAPFEAELDPDQMDKVVMNLVTNAIRHAREGGEVQVQVERHDAGESPTWTLTVRDDGPGIAPELRERIFEPFFQGPGETEGMGLGLALSRDVVVLHRGRLVVRDEGPGAVFQATLPCLLTSRPSREPSRTPVMVPPTRLAVAPSGPVTGDADGGAMHPAGRESGRVLVVEDDSGLRQFIADQLGLRHEVRTASRGDEALSILREWPADAIVSDVVMQGIDGVALCRILKADPLTRNIPLVLLTARGARADQLEGLGAGADDYIVKPFDPEQLRLKVDNLMQLRRNLEDRFRRALPAWSSILLRAGAEPLDRPSEQFLEKLYGVLVAHIPDQEFDVEQLARALAMSRASLYRRVKELLGATPVDLLQTVRLEHAALLLRTEDDTIASIAHRTGFKWAPTFTVRFTAHFGMTPSAYRALHRQEGPEAG